MTATFELTADIDNLNSFYSEERLLTTSEVRQVSLTTLLNRNKPLTHFYSTLAKITRLHSFFTTKTQKYQQFIVNQALPSLQGFSIAFVASV